MKGLLEMLAKSSKEDGDAKSPARDSDSVGASGNVDGDGSDVEPSEGFAASATQAMDALQAGNSAEFAEALKACIEMVG